MGHVVSSPQRSEHSAADAPEVVPPGADDGGRLVVPAHAGDFLPDRPRIAEARWHVLHTRPRQEKALAAALTGMGVSCFLPLRRHVRRRESRRIESELPLFPSYVFLWGTRDETFRADRTRRVACIIPVHDQETLEWELRNLHLALRVSAPLDPYEALRTGLRARIVAGPFQGLQGVIADRVRRDRLVLQVRMLGTATSLEVDAGLVQLIDE